MAGGAWVHVFPEGHVGYSGRLEPCRWGVGRLVCDAAVAAGRCRDEPDCGVVRQQWLCRVLFYDFKTFSLEISKVFSDPYHSNIKVANSMAASSIRANRTKKKGASCARVDFANVVLQDLCQSILSCKQQLAHSKLIIVFCKERNRQRS